MQCAFVDVVNPASIEEEGCTVSGDRAVGDPQRTTVLDSAAQAVNCLVARDRAVHDSRKGLVLVQDPAAVGICTVARDRTIPDDQCCAAVPDPTARNCAIVGDRAVDDRQCALVMVGDPAAAAEDVYGSTMTDCKCNQGQATAVLHPQYAISSGSTSAWQSNRVTGGSLNDGARRAISLDNDRRCDEGQGAGEGNRVILGEGNGICARATRTIRVGGGIIVG